MILKLIRVRPSTSLRCSSPSDVARRTFHTAELIATGIAGLVLVLTIFSVTRADEPPSTTANPAAEDVSRIAAWLTGSNVRAAAFDRPYGDAERLLNAKDTIFYTDVEGVTVPRGLRRVSYDFIQPRMQLIRGGNEVDPAVLITRSVADDPKEGNLAKVTKRTARKVKPGERYYYVEVATGNLAWHFMKLAVYEVDGKPEVESLWSMVS